MVSDMDDECGDGRFDSMGHSAKYCVYRMFSSDVIRQYLHVNVLTSLYII